MSNPYLTSADQESEILLDLVDNSWRYLDYKFVKYLKFCSSQMFYLYRHDELNDENLSGGVFNLAIL